MENKTNNRYSQELTYILSTPPRWIVKYGQLIMFIFFAFSLILLATIPSYQSTVFDAAFYPKIINNETILNAYSLNLDRESFLRLRKGQKSSAMLYSNFSSNMSLSGVIDSMYTEVREEKVKYYVRIKFKISAKTNILKSPSTGTCTIETKRGHILNI